MRSLFEPHLVNDTFGDPGLLIDFRDERRALLFDLGDISSLPPRKLMRLSHVFVTHTHMDHFAGFDHLLRVVLGRKDRIVFHGGPDFVAQVEHKLRAYTWNVVHRYPELVIDAREVRPDGSTRRACFSSRMSFERDEAEARGANDAVDVAATHAARAAQDAHDSAVVDGDVIHDEPVLRIRARFVDHDIPCLAYAIEEKGQVRVARDRLDALGVSPGKWLRDLKHAVLTGAPRDLPIVVEWRDRSGDHAMTRTVGDLSPVILDVTAGRRIGYVTDLRYSEANIAALSALLGGVDMLFIESVFLDCDAAHGARKNHLTARQAGEIARRVGAKRVIPFHFSPRYEGRSAEIAAEVDAAFRGDG